MAVTNHYIVRPHDLLQLDLEDAPLVVVIASTVGDDTCRVENQWDAYIWLYDRPPFYGVGQVNTHTGKVWEHVRCMNIGDAVETYSNLGGDIGNLHIAF